MLVKTHTSFAPWIIVKANDKMTARLESIRYVLSRISYPKDEEMISFLNPDPDIVTRYQRQAFRID